MGRFLLLIAFVAFISLGLPDGLLGVAWTSMYPHFGIPVNAMGVLVLGATAGYVVSTVLSGKLVARMGIGRLLALSCALTASALIGYTVVPLWWMAALLGVLAGFGGGAIDAAINNYISKQYRALLFLLHAMFGIGTTAGPLIMNAAINNASWQVGYWAVGAFQLGLALTFLVTARAWDVPTPSASEEAPAPAVKAARLRDTARLPVVWLGVAFFLLYTGVEASIGQWSHTLLTQSRGIDANTSALFIGAYWGAFTFGRVVSGLVVRVLSERTFLRLSLFGVVLGTSVMWLNVSDTLSLLALPFIGFCVAPVFPSMVGSTQDRLPASHVANAIGFQIGAAGLGGGVIIGLAGLISAGAGLPIIFLLHLGAALAIYALYEAIQARTSHALLTEGA
jgi:fucose permease